MEGTTPSTPIGPSTLFNSTLLPTLLISFFANKYTPNTRLLLQSEYDYIIVGAGAGGSALAGRLSEKSCAKVLLLEAGGRPNRFTEIPGIARAFVGTNIDWDYKTAPQRYTGEALNNRQLKWPSGKVIGGSSIFNAMLFVRGHRSIYDRWAQEGATGWSYDDVLPYFKKLERYIKGVDPEYHGYNGPVVAEQPNYYNAQKMAILEAAETLKYPLLDSNGPFVRGMFNFTGTLINGTRCSAAKAYLVPVDNRANLDIVSNAHVTKVILERGDDGKLRAAGVEVLRRGRVRTRVIRARKEVILAAGAVNTPQLLLLSGIGPRWELERMGIPVAVDLPGVGKNFQDHCGVVNGYTITDTLRPYMEKLMNPVNVLRYLNRREGPYATTEGITNMAFFTNDRNASNDAVPDHELYFLEAVPFVARTQTNVRQSDYQEVFGPYENRTAMWCVSQILHPRSRGTITLASRDPFAPPVVDPNYFEQDEDITDVVEGLKQCDAIFEDEALKKLEAKPFAIPFPNCRNVFSNKEQYYRCVAKSFVITLSHPAGTARMGDPNNSTTVVDPKLKVVGVENLRVVDASVMPIVPGGNTNIPTMMVGEKAADIIKETITNC